MAEAAGPLVVAVGEGLVGPAGVVSDLVVVAAEGGEVVDWWWVRRGPRVGGGRGRSRRRASDSRGRCRCGWRASTWRRWAVVGRRRVVPLSMTWPVSGWVRVHRHSAPGWFSATWRAMSAMTGPYPASSPGSSASRARVVRSTWMSTVPRRPPRGMVVCRLGGLRRRRLGSGRWCGSRPRF